MDTERPASSHHGLGLIRSVARIVRFRRSVRGDARSDVLVTADGDFRRKGLPDYYVGSSIFSSLPGETEKDVAKKQVRSKEAMEFLVARLFASISAVKASYAQLQVAQSPYDPETIQSADRAVVAELKNISQLKQSYFSKHFDGWYQNHQLSQDSQLVAEIQEQRNLLKTFQISTKKLENEALQKEQEISSLRGKLLQLEKQNASLETKIHPNSSLLGLDDLHLSGLNPTHFVSLLRCTVKSIRSFVKATVYEMETSCWDLGKAAASIEPDVDYMNPLHREFVFQSYVCRKMFSDFQNPSFGLHDSDDRNHPPNDRQRYFNEFLELKSLKTKQIANNNAFWKFFRAKYESVVHPEMEAAFSGSIDRTVLLDSLDGLPNTPFLLSFAEMARRVWLLHRLFFSFDKEAEALIFQVRKGCRYSAVYMDSVESSPEVSPAVGFTVVPGFKVGKTVIQSKVHLARKDGRS